MRLRNPFEEQKPAKEYATVEYPHDGQIKQDYDPDDPTAVSQHRQGRQILMHGVETEPQQIEQYHALAGKAGRPVLAHYKKRKRAYVPVGGELKITNTKPGQYQHTRKPITMIETDVPTGDWIARDPRAINADEKSRVKDYQQFEQYRQKTYGKQIKSPEGMVHKSAFGVEYKRDAKGRFATIDTRTAQRSQGQYKFVIASLLSLPTRTNLTGCIESNLLLATCTRSGLILPLDRSLNHMVTLRGLLRLVDTSTGFWVRASIRSNIQQAISIKAQG